MASYPTEDEIRAALIARMRAYCAATGEKPSGITKEVLKDASFWHKLVTGRNFTLATYQKLQAYLDKNWPDELPPE